MIVGIGCDIVEIQRFENKSENFIKKVLSDEEFIIYNQKVGKKKTEFLAGRFCAKESLIKALPKEEEISMPNINIFYENEKPTCKIKDYDIFLSISHEKKYVTSFACIQKKAK